MNTFLSTLAITFTFMVPSWPSILIALFLVHLAIRMRGPGPHHVFGGSSE